MLFEYVKATLIITTWFNFMASLWYAVLFQNWAVVGQAVIMLIATMVIAAIKEVKKR